MTTAGSCGAEWHPVHLRRSAKGQQNLMDIRRRASTNAVCTRDSDHRRATEHGRNEYLWMEIKMARCWLYAGDGHGDGVIDGDM
jgi:hypothetical protein